MSAGSVQLHQISDGMYLPQNLLVNPGFEIWQRGAGPFTTTLTMTADEWKLYNGSGTATINQEATIKTVGAYSFKMVTAGGTADIRQGIELDQSLASRTLTFSADVWCDTAAAFGLRLYGYNGAFDGSNSDMHPGDSQWHRLTVVHQMPAVITSYAQYPHSFGMATYLQAWAACTAYVDGASLVIGNYPQGVPFIPLNPADDQQRCERFYEKHTSLRERGYSNGGVEQYNVPFRADKYAVPTMSMTASVAGVTTVVTAEANDTHGYDVLQTVSGAGNTGFSGGEVTAEVT